MLEAHADEVDKRYLPMRKAILERDKHTCVFCGFKAKKYQELHHLDDDHGHNAAANLVTACSFCHLDFHLALAGIKNAGLIIWCPELSQAAINNVSRAIFIAVANKGAQEDAARTLYNSLESRAAITEEQLGKGASNPTAIAQGLLSISPEAYESRGERLHGFRMLPRMTAFSKQIAYWQSDEKIFGALPDRKWESLLAQSSQKVEEAEA